MSGVKFKNKKNVWMDEMYLCIEIEGSIIELFPKRYEKDIKRYSMSPQHDVFDEVYDTLVGESMNNLPVKKDFLWKI